MNQGDSIKLAINSLLDVGYTDKSKIYSRIVIEFGVPRPTVRRIVRDLRNELLHKIRILESNKRKKVNWICGTCGCGKYTGIHLASCKFADQEKGVIR